MNVNLVAQVCMYNEVEKGNLDRCLDNLRQYCDHIVIYDDASTDNSVEVALKYGAYIIQGKANNQNQELAHKQLILEKSLEFGPTHLFWLDCDEVLDRAGTMGGLRSLCESWSDELDAYSFREVNLWRSQTWQRLDTLFTKARFVRLWKVIPGITFDIQEGVHKRLYPVTIKNVQEAPFGIIHYGFHDYKKMMVKIGAHRMNQKELHRCAITNWILDERECTCQKVPDSDFPPGCLPPDIWEQPKPRTIRSLETHDSLTDSELPLLLDRRAREEWNRLHKRNYHTDIHARNKSVWGNQKTDILNLMSMFKFNPKGKVVFDIGCGGGWYMLECLLNGAKKVVGFEINSDLIERAETSFQELGVQSNLFCFISSYTASQTVLKADIVYSIALFMHLPFWQASRYFQWIYEVLKPDGEAHLQFYQVDGITMFWDGTTEGKGDSVSTIRLDHELERTGLKIESKHLAEGDGVLPVWQMYRCIKGTI
jgi:SAM-dependent methyltransferase